MAPREGRTESLDYPLVELVDEGTAGPEDEQKPPEVILLPPPSPNGMTPKDPTGEAPPTGTV